MLSGARRRLVVAARLPHLTPAENRSHRLSSSSSMRNNASFIQYRSNTGDFSLTQVSDEAVPPNAILSHP